MWLALGMPTGNGPSEPACNTHISWCRRLELPAHLMCHVSHVLVRLQPFHGVLRGTLGLGPLGCHIRGSAASLKVPWTYVAIEKCGQRAAGEGSWCSVHACKKQTIAPLLSRAHASVRALSALQQLDTLPVVPLPHLHAGGHIL